MRHGSDHPVVQRPRGEGVSKSARRRKLRQARKYEPLQLASTAALAAEEAERHRLALALAAEAEGARLASLERDLSAQKDRALLREAVADAERARLEASFQRGVESRLELEAVALSSRTAEAVAQFAREARLRAERNALEVELLARPPASQPGSIQSRTPRVSPGPPHPASSACTDIPAPSEAAGAPSPPPAALGAPAAPVPDHRDEEIAVLRFKLQDLVGAARRRSVALASAFVHNDNNELHAVPPARERSVSPWLGDTRPAVPSPPPAPRPLIKLVFGPRPATGSSTAVALARRSAAPLPPWAVDH
jgi:hypothetical protein